MSCLVDAETLFPSFKPRRSKDLTGLVVGRLTVRNPSHYEHLQGHWFLFWRCDCECGGTCLVEGSHLRYGHTQSCGCISLERIAALNKTHGLRRHTLYKRWHEMLRRCRDPRARAYRNYGARGITFDPAWQDFDRFYSDMAASFQPGLTLERVDNNGPYNKVNCIWATYKQQANNTRVNHLVTVNGVTRNITQWAELIGKDSRFIHRRLKAGWPAEKAVLP